MRSAGMTTIENVYRSRAPTPPAQAVGSIRGVAAIILPLGKRSQSHVRNSNIIFDPPSSVMESRPRYDASAMFMRQAP
jgi:hypothetical protein